MHRDVGMVAIAMYLSCLLGKMDACDPNSRSRYRILKECPVKFGIINVLSVLDQSKRGKVYAQRLRKKAEQWQAQTRAVESKLQQVRQMAEKEENAAPDRKMKLQRETTLLETEMRQLEERMRQDLESSQEHYRTLLLTDAQALITELAKELDLDAVFSVPSQDTAYVAERVDITSKLLAKLDAKADLSAKE